MHRRVFAVTMLGMFLSVLCAVGATDDKRRDDDHRTDAKRIYTSLSQLTVAQRGVIFRNLPSDMKAAIWVVHLQNFLRLHPEVDLNQRAIVNTAISIADSVPYDEAGNPTSEGRELATRLELAARLSFSHELLGTFYDLGDSNAPATVSTETLFRQGTTMASDTDPSIMDDCSCSRGHDWCGSGQCSNVSCKQVAAGCGFMLMFTCDGSCN